MISLLEFFVVMTEVIARLNGYGKRC